VPKHLPNSNSITLPIYSYLPFHRHFLTSITSFPPPFTLAPCCHDALNPESSHGPTPVIPESFRDICHHFCVIRVLFRNFGYSRASSGFHCHSRFLSSRDTQSLVPFSPESSHDHSKLEIAVFPAFSCLFPSFLLIWCCPYHANYW
jgi:hypothetical protein